MTAVPPASPDSAAARTSSGPLAGPVAGPVAGEVAGPLAGEVAGPLAGRVVLVAGATVLAVGTRPDALAALASAVPGVDVRICDLADRDAVAELAMRIHLKFGPVDGLIHLVGGWRGGGGITGQSDDDWDALERSFRTLRNTTRIFYDDLVASSAGRLAIVSSTAVERPYAGGAGYAAAKAAADAWTRAVAQGFAKEAPNAAAAVFVVKTLAGLEERLGSEVVRLWDADPSTINGIRIPLTEKAAGSDSPADPARMDG